MKKRRGTHPALDELRQVFTYNPDTGVFSSLKTGASVGTRNNGYIRIGFKRQLYYAHQLAVLWMTGKWAADVVDHIDGNKSNNRWNNLRVVTHAVNLQNMTRGHSDSKLGILGVSETPHGTFRAQICVSGKNKTIGTFKTLEEAKQAYLAEKAVQHKGAVQ